MAETAEAYRDRLPEFDEINARAMKAEAAVFLAKADFKFRAGEFGLRRTTVEAASEADAEAKADLDALDEALSIRESAAIRRIHAALSLLEIDTVAEVVPSGRDLREEARVLYPVAGHIGRHSMPALRAALQSQQALIAVCGKIQGNEQNERIFNAVRRGGKRLRDVLQELGWKLGNSVAYPFEHGDGQVSLGQYALPRVPNPDDINGLLNATGQAVDKTIALYYRVLGRLTLAAEEVEKAIGLKPLPALPKDDAEEKA